MAGRRRGRYPPEYKERIVELARAGRSPGSLAREFEPSEQTIRNWVKQADLDEGLRSDGLTTEARKELRELKRDNKRLRMERDILKKAAAWFARESESTLAGVCVHEGVPGRVPACGHVPGAGSLPQRVLRLAEPSALGASGARHRAQSQDQGDLARQRRDLRLPADPRGALGRRRACEPEASGTPDEGAGHQGRDAQALSRRARRRGTPRPSPRRTW